MFITVKGFRSIDHYEVEFQKESITLLSGPSGIGKTTIMNAIYWCMYGSLKNVRKFGMKSGTCSVCVELGTISITRSKSPECLLVVLNRELVLKDQEAQQKINELFGSSDIWLSSCYLRQGTRNRFMESSPSERLELLNQLCYSSDSPELHLEKIEDKCKSLTKEFERRNDFFKRDLENFQTKRKEYPNYTQDILDPQTKSVKLQEAEPKQLLEHLEAQLFHAQKKESDYNSLSQTRDKWIQSFPDYKIYLLTPEQLLELQNVAQQSPLKSNSSLDQQIQQLEKQQTLLESYMTQILDREMKQPLEPLEMDELLLQERKESLPILIQQLEKSLIQEREKRNLFQTLSQRKKKLEEQLSSLPCHQDVQEKLKSLTLAQKNLQLKREHDILQKLLEPLVHLLSDTLLLSRDVSDEELDQAFIRDQKIATLTKYAVEPNLSAIQKAIELRGKLLQAQPLWKMVGSIQEYEAKIEERDNKIQGLGKRKDWISEKDLPTKILELQTSRTAIHCPKCKTSLRYEQNQLMEVYGCHTKDKLEFMEKLIQDSAQRNEWLKDKEKLKNEMNELIQTFEVESKGLDVFSFPKLDDVEVQNLVLEKSKLEEILVDWHAEPQPSKESLILSKNKWKAEQIQKQIQALGYETKDDDEKEVEEAQKTWLGYASKHELFQKENHQLEEELHRIQFQQSLEELEKQWKQKVAELERVREDQERWRKYKEMEELKKKVQELSDLHIDQELDDKRKERTKREEAWERKREEISNAKERLNLYEKSKNIEDLSLQINSIILDASVSEIKGKIQQVRTKAEEARLALMQSEKAEILAKEKETLTKDRSELVGMSLKVSSISKIKLIANELEHQRMISILETINEFANELLTILFDDPMKIEFSIFKQMKTKDKVKPSIHYKIFYKGFEVDHLDQISGGEADRVSLAVTCALFQFSKFPFLLLDEFASSLDLNTKENAIKTLKTFLGVGTNQRKSILCISHDTVEGIYDHMVKLG